MSDAAYLFTNEDVPTLLDFYASNLRGALFGGLLGAASLLLALKTWIVSQMRDKVYTNQGYLDWMAEYHPGISAEKVCQPLKRLSRNIVIAIAMNLIGAIAQFTFGLVAANWAIWIALILAGAGIASLGWCVWVSQGNNTVINTLAVREAKAKMRKLPEIEVTAESGEPEPQEAARVTPPNEVGNNSKEA